MESWKLYSSMSFDSDIEITLTESFIIAKQNLFLHIQKKKKNPSISLICVFYFCKDITLEVKAYLS